MIIFRNILLILFIFANINLYNYQSRIKISTQQYILADESQQDTKSSVGNTTAKILMAIAEGATVISGIIEDFFEKGLGCSEVHYPTLSLMLGIDISAVSSTADSIANSQNTKNFIDGAMDGFSNSEGAICVSNAIAVRSQLLAGKGSLEASKIIAKKASATPEPKTKAILSTIASVLEFTGYTLYVSAITTIVAFYFKGIAIADNARVCLDDTGIYSYTKEQIMQIMRKSGETVSDTNILAKEGKMCIEYNDNYYWMKAGECNGSFDDIICVKNLPGYAYILCGYTPAGCPCNMNLQFGFDKLPTYEKNSDGSLKLDDSGTPIMTSSSQKYKDKFLKHCRITLPDKFKYDARNEYSGILDDTCYNLTGNSKRYLPITGGIAECMYNTARNIFEKPIFRFVRSLRSHTSEQEYEKDIEMFSKYKKDIETIGDTNVRFSELSHSDKLVVKEKLNSILNYKTVNTCYYCNNLNDGSKTRNQSIAFKEKYGSFVNNCKATNACCESGSNPFSLQRLNLCYDNFIESFEQDSSKSIIMNLENIDNDPNTISDLLFYIENELIEKKSKHDNIVNLTLTELSEDKNTLTLTMFDRFNNQIRFIATILIVFWIAMVGFRIIQGEIQLKTKDIADLGMRLGLTYYFVFGNAWKDFVFRMMMTISQAIGFGLMDISMIGHPMKDRICSYGSTDRSVTSINNEPVVCNLDEKLICNRYNSKGNCIGGECKSTKFAIPALDYQRPYNIVEYYLPNELIWKEIQVYCRYGSENLGTYNAEKIFNSSLGKYIWYCPKENSFMEEGYRAAIYNQMGIPFSGYISTQVVPTAIKVPDNYGRVDNSQVVKLNNQDEILKRLNNSEVAERARSRANKDRDYIKYRYYGVERDTKYLRFFDMTDCRIMRLIFLGFGSNQSDVDFTNIDVKDIAGGVGEIIKVMIVMFPYGLISAVLMFLIAASLLIVALRALQAYVVGMFGLVCYVYLSPIFFLLRMFKKTEKAFDKWLDGIKGYLVMPPIAFLSVGIYLSIIDVALFGNPAKYSELFDFNGGIKSNCYDAYPEEAPIACIMSKIMSRIDINAIFINILMTVAFAAAGSAFLGSTGAYLGAALGMGVQNTISIKDLFLPFIMKLFFAAITVYAGLKLLDVIEKQIKGMIGLKGGNTSIGMGLEGDISSKLPF